MFAKAKSEENKTTSSGATIIARGTVISGDLSCDNDIRIDGELEGNINSTCKVVVGAQGLVRGIIHCRQADVMGAIEGDVYASEMLTIRSKAMVKGDIFTASLELENAAIFNGRCEMQSTAEGEEAAKPAKSKGKGATAKEASSVLEPAI